MKKSFAVAAIAGIGLSASLTGAAAAGAEVKAPTSGILTVEKFAALEFEDRSAVVTGTATCPAGAVYIVGVGLTQERSGNSADWEINLAFPACTGEPAPWSVPVNMTTPWSPGPTDAHVVLIPYQSVTPVAEVVATVRLRR